MQTLEYKKCTTDEHLRTVAVLADQIWHECYRKILPAQQIDYMVRTLQSFESLKEQLENGTEYYMIEIDGLPVGYYAFEKRSDDVLYGKDYLFISKMYLLADIRHKGFASLILKQIRKYARANGFELIKLYVNRKNEHAISVYKHKGMRLIDELDRDIGEGFVAEDYIFGKMI
ncbi:Acetyltransferase (GNAT) family protein [Ruminococcus sp. YE71]|uniref:GNAT family N-acetyltransferase n=1 Tax=unclassified Ruminococcus TaxID=2608920 RepID=UPI00089119C3|nr:MULTISPECIES: GNAT family N-acetyltransferase [unclassified Ruminococcus]SDA21227.1 Acetyltransferase (GNAT) family protein [Ruminococcus sp. YE78]SFW32879.1 Acetyltransferase (GNAT) family protein [Ruminococcus sp. YE71]